MEGISHEACSLAGTLGLGKLNRVLRRQRHLHRRRGQGVVHRRHPGPVRRLRLARGARRGRPRRRCGRRRDSRRARGRRSAVAPVLQDDHRIRRTEQGGQGVRTRRAARRRRDRGARARGWDGPTLPSKSPATSTQELGCACTGRGASSRVAGTVRSLACRVPAGGGGIRAADVGRASRRVDGDLHPSHRFGPRGGRERRVAQGVAERPGGARADAARADRRLRRPHRVEPHEMERIDGPHPARTETRATSSSGYANSR